MYKEALGLKQKNILEDALRAFNQTLALPYIENVSFESVSCQLNFLPIFLLKLHYSNLGSIYS